MGTGWQAGGRDAVRWGLAQLRKPELMVFLPAVTLAAFWIGGERALIFVALGTPMAFAIAGAFRFDAPAPAGQSLLEI